LIGTQRIQSDVNTGVTTSTSLYQIPTLSGCGAFFDYCVIDGSDNKRLGTVMATWDSSGAAFTDTSTPDLNGSTIGLGFTVTVSGANVNFNSVVTSGTWTIRLSVRVVY